MNELVEYRSPKLWHFALLAALSLALLLPTLCFPISPDLTIFLYGGKTIAEGGSMYVDFVDLKPPAIYLFMAPVYTIFGGSEMSIRVFDILYQLFTVLSLFYVVHKRSENHIYGWSAAILYLVLYAGLHFAATFQCETIIAPGLAWAIYFASGKSNLRNAAYAGAIIGVCSGFKYTFGLVALFMFLCEFSKEGEKPLKRAIVFGLSAFAGLIATHLPLLAEGSIHGYFGAMGFLKVYATYTPGVETGLKPLLKNTANYFSDNIPLSYIALIVLGFYYALSRSGRKIAPFFLEIIATIAALFLSVVVEGKYFGYHWTRMYAPLMMIAAPGVGLAYSALKRFRAFDTAKIAIIITLMGAGVLFSPVWRIAINFSKAKEYFKNPYAFGALYDRSEGAIHRSLNEWRYIANSLKSKISRDDLVLILSHGDQPLYYYLQANRIDKFAHSGFYLSPKATREYQEEFIYELRNAKALIFRTDKGDLYNLGRKEPEWVVIRNFPVMNGIITAQYEQFLQTPNFRVLIRK